MQYADSAITPTVPRVCSMLFQHDLLKSAPGPIVQGSNGPHCELLPPEAELLPKRKLRPKDLSLPFHKLHNAHQSAVFSGRQKALGHALSVGNDFLLGMVMVIHCAAD